MLELDEPAEKKQCTIYELCLFCQEETVYPVTDINHVNFKYSSYDTFLTNLHKRPKLGNLNLVSASKRLLGVSGEVLKEKRTTWHLKCYKLVTNCAHKKRDEANYRKSCASKCISTLTNRKRGRPSLPQQLQISTTTEPRITRSQSQGVAFVREKCFFFLSKKDCR